MNRYVSVFIVALFLCAGTPFAQESHVEAPVIGDLHIPLMPGLQELETSRILFDKPEGRIVETELAGPVAAQAAREYYGNTLPPLGWVADPQEGRWLVFHRDGEQLNLGVREDPNGIVIEVSLRPAS